MMEAVTNIFGNAIGIAQLEALVKKTTAGAASFFDGAVSCYTSWPTLPFVGTRM